MVLRERDRDRERMMRVVLVCERRKWVRVVLVVLLVVLMQLSGRRGLLMMKLLRVRVLMGLRRGQWRERHLLLLLGWC